MHVLSIAVQDLDDSGSGGRQTARQLYQTLTNKLELDGL